MRFEVFAENDRLSKKLGSLTAAHNIEASYEATIRPKSTHRPSRIRVRREAPGLDPNLCTLQGAFDPHRTRLLVCLDDLHIARPGDYDHIPVWGHACRFESGAANAIDAQGACHVAEAFTKDTVRGDL